VVLDLLHLQLALLEQVQLLLEQQQLLAEVVVVALHQEAHKMVALEVAQGELPLQEQEHLVKEIMEQMHQVELPLAVVVAVLHLLELQEH